jgi:hypothetical protein
VQASGVLTSINFEGVFETNLEEFFETTSMTTFYRQNNTNLKPPLKGTMTFARKTILPKLF